MHSSLLSKSKCSLFQGSPDKCVTRSLDFWKSEETKQNRKAECEHRQIRKVDKRRMIAMGDVKKVTGSPRAVTADTHNNYIIQKLFSVGQTVLQNWGVCRIDNRGIHTRQESTSI